MRDQHKIRSVIELARYRVGDVVWWVILRPTKNIPNLDDSDKWMMKHHPKVLYKGPYKDLWPRRAVLPKLQHMDFANIMSLLTSRLVVEQFVVCDILRSRDTGEFFYSNDRDEWMPENMMLDTKQAADKEKSRILKMIKNWIDSSNS